uniref:Succinate-CoA ligase subunit beta n=1 Tax=Globodera pallida TaxID=36090 RepID=A0A183CD68_GLOPA
MLLRQSGCTVQDFFLVEQGVREADKHFHKTAFAEYVIKAQILAGGRGKGRFIDCPKDGGGIRITKSIEKAISHVNGMLGKRLVTRQTSDQGVLVNKVMVAESITIIRETYLSIIMDPTSTGPVIVACPMGGMDIEEIAINQPELIFKERISVLDGVTEVQCQRVANRTFLDFRETMAKKCGLSYIGLDGNIACMVNGAGLAMATMDIIKLHGGEPANFLDLGGGATVQQVKEACRIILTDSAKLRVIFVNVFCGILRCDVVAQGILEAMANSKLDIPVVIRLKGTRMAEAKELIAGASHLGIFECYDSFEEAAKRAVRLSHGEDAELCTQREKHASRA